MAGMKLIILAALDKSAAFSPDANTARIETELQKIASLGFGKVTAGFDPSATQA